MPRKNFLCTFLLVSSLFSDETNKSLFKPNYTFSNISINFLDWTNKTEKSSYQRDFPYIELEGGAGWDWGEFYMFFDVENPTKSYSEEPMGNLRIAFKPVLDIKIADSDFYIHVQDYNFHSKEFYISNLVTGFAYKFSTDTAWFKPFFGLHHQESTYYDGFNGYIAGWTFLYGFDISENKFSISQWHEHKLRKDEDDALDKNRFGVQGALSFWWHPIKEITTGVQYRYSEHDLGYEGYMDGLIYSLKYNF